MSPSFAGCDLSSPPPLTVPQVVAVGDCPIAMTPERDGSLVFADGYRRMLAGAELNVCIGCARLEISSGLIARVSSDPFGDYTLRRLRAEKVDVSQIAAEDKPSPLLFKERLPGGDFRVHYYRRQSAGGAVERSSAMENYVRRARAFVFSGIFPALSPRNLQTLNALLKAAKAAKTARVFDPNIRMKLLQTPAKARRLLLPLAAQSDLILIGEDEAKMLFGTDSADKLFSRLAAEGIRHAVLKRGDLGAQAVEDGRRCEVSARPAAAIVDSCGAGDAFNAGYLAAWIRRRSLRRRLELAAYCGARVVASDSDNEHMPFLAEAESPSPPPR